MEKKRKKTSSMNWLFKGTIRGKIIMMGSYSIIAALLIGMVGIVSINKNSQNNKVESIVNDISSAQYQNQALEVSYQYYIDATYLDNIINSLEKMETKASDLEKLASAKYQDQIKSLKEKLELSQKNYSSLIEYDASRGYNEEKGNYSNYSSITEQLVENFKTLIDGNEWYEIKWIDAVMQGNVVNIDGVDYIKMTYTGPVPEIGKRNNLGVRVGGTFTFNKNYYVNNFRFTNGKEVQAVDFTELKQSSGEGVESAEFTTFNKMPSIHVKAKFDESNQTWEEAATDITIQEYDIQNYKNIEYDIYFEKTDDAFGFKYGGSINGYYLFSQQTDVLDSLVKNYSKMVVEGKDVSGQYEAIEAIFDEMIGNVSKYAIDPTKIEETEKLLTSKRDMYEAIKLQDADVLRIKNENAQLFVELENLCSNIKEMADQDMNTVKNSVLALTVIVLAISAVILLLTTLRTSARIQKSVRSFQKTLDDISAGDVLARVAHNGNDEFGQFGKSINSFMDKLQKIIQKLQQASLLLSTSGTELDERACRTKDAADVINCALRDISSGAAEQANDVESSSMKVIEMKDTIDGIINSVDELTKLTSDMKLKDDEATTIMLQLSKSNDTTTDAFRKIANQIRKTNDSVEKIQDAVDLIASIASQTNLLSLNASIEAARAGEAGKGFAVVASEIQKLAEQTNSSAGIINNIITSLSAESEQTVQSINELTSVVDEQGQNLEETKKRFASVSQGIQSTEKEMLEVRQQANTCSKSGETVGSIMVNLSAIAEENAASTEQTTNSMMELNDATKALAETADELKGLSQSLNEDLSFFRTK